MAIAIALPVSFERMVVIGEAVPLQVETSRGSHRAFAPAPLCTPEVLAEGSHTLFFEGWLLRLSKMSAAIALVLTCLVSFPRLAGVSSFSIARSVRAFGTATSNGMPCRITTCRRNTVIAPKVLTRCGPARSRPTA
jgi:hypothetical protein